jgi:hypothetical protein
VSAIAIFTKLPVALLGGLLEATATKIPLADYPGDFVTGYGVAAKIPTPELKLIAKPQPPGLTLVPEQPTAKPAPPSPATHADPPTLLVVDEAAALLPDESPKAEEIPAWRARGRRRGRKIARACR